MNPTLRAGGPGAAALTALLLVAAPGATAQELSWSSSAETGGDDLNLVYTQVSLTAGGLGWKPVGSLSGYWVGAGESDTWALSPQVGLRYRAGGGFFQTKVGYSFKNDEAVDFFGGGRNGFVTNAHGEYWGDGSLALQGIASYNWGSDYLWSRARVLPRLATLDNGGAVNLGGEIVWQGELEGEDDDLLDDVELDAKSSAIQVGPVVQWISGGASIWAVSGGWKRNKVGDFEDDTWYLKLEFTISP